MKVTIIEKLQSLPEEIKKTDKWKLAMAIALDNGSGYFDEMYEAVDCYLHLGFTPEEICKQINFGSLNVEPEQLKEVEQQFIETLKPTYNQMNEKDLDIERRKEYQKTDKGKESQKKAVNKYQNQLCSYSGQTLTLNALRMRFKRQGIINPTQEAKKYLIKKESKTPIEFYDVYP